VLLAPFRATPQWAYVPVILEIDGATLLAGQRGDRLQVEIYAYATDERGEMRGFFAQEIGLDVSRGPAREQVAQTGLKYYGHLELAPGSYRVRTLVRNAETGRTAVAVSPVSIPRYEEAQAVVLPPFFPEPSGRWLMVRERQDGGQAGSTVYPFTINGEPYVPAARPEIGPGQDARFCLVAYNLGKGDLDLGGEVLDETGIPIPGADLSLVERTATGIEGYDKLLANLRIADLAAGDYTLRVSLTDRATGRTEANSIAFSVQN
jgi:hypothetical protein